MATQSVIPVREAMKTRFQSSTTQELLAYLEEVGVDIGGPPHDQHKLRAALCAAIGITDSVGAEKRVSQKAVKVNDVGIRPPYNLTPIGLWGGRRHRITLPRPESAKLARAEPVSWNGKPPFWVPFDEVVSVPEPIYNILRSRRRTISVKQNIVSPDGSTETTTAWEFAEFPMVYHGIDPLTADRCGSMTEWFQDKGPAFYKDPKRSLRELVAVATLLDVAINKSDMMRSPKAEPDLIADILTFLYGYPDVEEGDK